MKKSLRIYLYAFVLVRVEKLLCFLGIASVGLFEDKWLADSEAGRGPLFALYHNQIRLLADSLYNLSH